MKIHVLAMMPLVGMLAMNGCDQRSVDPSKGKVTSEDVRRDAERAVETASAFSQQAKEDFKKSMQSQLSDLDSKVSELREKGRNLKDQAKTDWEKRMSELELKREAAATSLARVGESTADAWQDVKKGAQSAWAELDKAFQAAAREF
jgi:TolA-binding protein